MEWIDEFISDSAMTTLEILQYLNDIGSLQCRDEILYKAVSELASGLAVPDAKRPAKYNRNEQGIQFNNQFNNQFNYRIFVDDITNDIIDFLTDVDTNILAIPIVEILNDDFNKIKKLEYAPYFNFNKIKKNDQIFKSIKVNKDLWKAFVELSKRETQPEAHNQRAERAERATDSEAIGTERSGADGLRLPRPASAGSRQMKLDYLFKLAIIRFLERRYEFAKQIIENDGIFRMITLANDNDIWYMGKDLISSVAMTR